jgi:hypothetical protein
LEHHAPLSASPGWRESVGPFYFFPDLRYSIVWRRFLTGYRLAAEDFLYGYGMPCPLLPRHPIGPSFPWQRLRHGSCNRRPRPLEKFGKRGCRRVSFPHRSDWSSRRWQIHHRSLIIIFDLYGPTGYRRLEREALESILKQILHGTIIYK